MSAPPAFSEAERSVGAVLAALHAPYLDLPKLNSLPAHKLRFEVRTRWDKGQPETSSTLPRTWWRLDADGCLVGARHALAASRHYGVYFSCLPRLGRSGKSEDVPCGAALWASVDDKDGHPGGALALLVERTREGLPAPHAAIGSGGGVHALWLLDSAADLTDGARRDRFRSALRRLALKVGETEEGRAETNADYLSYMVRVPHSFNHKAAYVEQDGGPQETGFPGRPVRLLRFCPDAPRLPLVWWLATLPPDPREEEERRRRDRWKDWKAPDGGEPGSPGPRPLPPDVEAAIQAGCPPGERHKVAVRIGAVAAARGYDPAFVEGILERFAASAGWRPERREIANIVKKYCRAA